MSKANWLETLMFIWLIFYVFSGCNTNKASFDLGKSTRAVVDNFSAGYGK